MKKIVFIAFAMVGLVACLKTNNIPQSDRILVPITISATNLPDTANVGDTIVAAVRVTAPNLCYRFEGFDSFNSGEKQYDIQAVGSKPNPELPSTGCEQTVYVKDTTFKFKLPFTGKYVLRFYNGQQIFSADTLIIK